jgi:hypothetical protein
MITGQTDVLSTEATKDDSKVILPFNSRADVSALANPNPVTVNITALIELSKGGNTYKVNSVKTIQFQNQACCDGAVIAGGAYDYKTAFTYNSVPTNIGDGAKYGGASGTNDMAWSPNLNVGSGVYTSDTGLDSYFEPSGADLCVYKSTGANSGTVTWAAAVNGCANGSYADGETGWYLPNLRELQAIFIALGNTSSSANKHGGKVNFSQLQSPNYIATTAANMVADYYWSSTEDDQSYLANRLHFNTSYRQDSDKGLVKSYIRCVRRL